MEREEDVVRSSQFDENAVILAVSFSGGHLGAALYDQSRTTIRLLRDAADDFEFTLLKALFEQEEPTTILSNKGQDVRLTTFISVYCGQEPPPDDVYQEHLSDFQETNSVASSADASAAQREESTVSEDDTSEPLKPHGKDSPASKKADDSEVDEEDNDDGGDDPDEDDDESERKPILIFLPNNAYNYETGIKRISELFEEECLNDSENSIVTRFRVDLSSRNMVRSFGALLRYLDSARVGVEYEPLNVRTPVTAIKTIVVGNLLEIDRATFRALDIFAENRKAEKSYRHCAASNESAVSLFGLCNRCKSAVGKKTLRKWFERPTMNQDVLISRQQAISFFLQDCNLELTGKIYSLVGSMKSVRYILNRLRSGTAKVGQWEGLYKMISSGVLIGRYLEAMSTPLKLIEEDMHCFGDTLTETVAVLGGMIDFTDSLVENRIVVNANVDPELDRAKELYRRLPAILTRVAQEESRRLEADTCSVAYVPMIGYLLSVPRDFDVARFADLQVIFTTGDTTNVKSDRMRELDEELGDVKMKIIDKETTITIRTSAWMLSHSSMLLSLERVGSQLDAAISLALTARIYGWNRPKFVEEPIIDATRVVHPLSKIVTEHFVANPVSSGGESSRIKVFTGPNACGKSVYLKQVGILVFLAHIGSFVPAEVAHIGIVNRILTRMYSIDSVLDGMSTFAKDLNQVSIALRRGDERSLIIIDEFGKGTMTEVGLPLLASTLSYWAAKGNDGCPHIFVASHFHALPNFVTDEHDVVSYHTMEVKCRGADLDFQYRMVDGMVESSYAAYTASKMGVPKDVVDRAVEVYHHVRSGHALNELVVESEEAQRNRWLARQMLSILPQFLEWDIDNDLDGLLDLLEATLLEEDETIENGSIVKSQTQQTDAEETTQETLKSQDESPSSDKPSDGSNSGGEESVEVLEKAPEPLEESISSLPSALRGVKRSADRSNLSVSFAMDKAKNGDVQKGVDRIEVMGSVSESAGKMRRIVIADSDDDVTRDEEGDGSGVSPVNQQNVDDKECEVVVRSEDNFTTTGPVKRPFPTSSPCEATDRKRTRSF